MITAGVAIYTRVYVHYGNDDGTFDSPYWTYVYRRSGYPSDVAIADIDSDGDMDLILAQDGDSYLTYFTFLMKTGSFESQERFIGSGCRDQLLVTQQAAAADLNGDGLLDIAMPNPCANEVPILFHR